MCSWLLLRRCLRAELLAGGGSAQAFFTNSDFSAIAPKPSMWQVRLWSSSTSQMDLVRALRTHEERAVLVAEGRSVHRAPAVDHADERAPSLRRR